MAMGDMSDLPNFLKRPWYRAKRLRLLFIVVGAIIGTVAWCFSENDPSQDISVMTSVGVEHVMMGSAFTLETVVKNSGSRSAQMNLQAVLFMKAGACMDAGKRLPNSFSLPMSLTVAPNGSKTVILQFDSITAACQGTVGVEVFAEGKMDLDRFSFSRKLDKPAIELL